MYIKQIFLFLLVAFFLSCNPNSGNPSKEQYIESVQKKEFKKNDELYSNAGKLIGEFDFNVKATEEQKKDWEDGKIPWISLENPGSEINQLINADELVIKKTQINIIFDYPLNKPATFEFRNDKGFTRRDLVLLISEKYHEIYKEEELTSAVKTIPLQKRTGIINRNETQGKYGIWGHDLADLVLSGVEVHETSEGKINIILLIES
ncbi:hypothetical protein AAW12_23695 [Sphingobacterium sp. Ag1]|uniref:hypothetical protein n=1 Tax=Sphingobacterium sp. Ag1 TaxID=1643451 RepID=UPI000627F6A4|nr:hypothetical protein [Sphingobacterium sp. Ag1]KKO89139.1 hypothetical protein AAW12_23695 [Sphingobacterium sp. Ag1]